MLPALSWRVHDVVSKLICLEVVAEHFPCDLVVALIRRGADPYRRKECRRAGILLGPAIGDRRGAETDPVLSFEAAHAGFELANDIRRPPSGGRAECESIRGRPEEQ